MRFRSTITIAAPADRVWAIYRDVVHWPDWTASTTSVERLDPGPFGVGSRARIVQPRLPVAEWTVTELTEPAGPVELTERSFTWVSTAPGVRTTGRHLVRGIDAGRCEATAELTQQGPLGVLVGLAYRRLIARYLDVETTGLRDAATTGRPVSG